MNEYSIVVDFQKGNIYTDLSVLVQNDYNAYKLNFEFDKEFERALFKLKYPVENKEWVQDIVDNKLILPVLKDTGDYEYEISIYSEDGRLTGYATEKFHVRSELINTDEIVEPDDRVPVLDNLINETTQLKNETASLKEEVEDAIEETNNLNIDVSDKVNKEVNITLTKKDNTTKRVTLKDGTSLMFNWDGTRLGIKTDEDEEYVYVDLIGRTGPMGPQGEAFQVKKTYANINLMIADYDNMQINDYVMIDGNIEQEDNAKLFVKQEVEDPTYRWHYLADFSGATGIQGPTGLTPNIQIGTITSGNTPSVSRTGTNENPILNFVLQQGPQGEIGPTGATGETGNGILNIMKLSSVENIDTYQINMTDGTYYQFTVTNSTVTNQEFEDLKAKHERLINTLPKVEGAGENIIIENTSEYNMNVVLNPSELSQEGTPTTENPIPIKKTTGNNNIEASGKNLYDESKITDVSTYRSTATINNDKSITITSTGTNGYAIIRPFFNFKANETYTVSFDVDNISNYNHMYLFINTSTTGGGYSKNPYVTITKTTDSLLGIGIYPNANATITISNIQIEKNTTKTSYEPYQGQNYPITLSSKNLLNIPSNLTFKATYSIDMELEAGNYTLSWSSVFTDSTNTRANIIMRYEDGTTSGNNFVDFTSTSRTLNPTKKVNRIYFYSDVGAASSANITITYENLMLEQGSTATKYEPYIANPLEYCKIGDYADQIFKNTKNSELYDNTLIENEWYLKKKVLKIDSYNGEAITTLYISTTGGLNTGATVYYGLETPTYIHISQADYPILRSQLENLYNNAKSYNGQTNITQTNDGLPFNIELSALRDLSTL